MKRQLIVSFKGKKQPEQLALFLVLLVYRKNGELVGGKLLFQIKGRKLRKQLKEWEAENEH